MKKTLALLLVLTMLLTLVACSSNSTLPSSDSTLPKGYASRIDFMDGWKIGPSSFEYLNDNTVKITRTDDGQIFYVPISSIDMIWVN